MKTTKPSNAESTENAKIIFDNIPKLLSIFPLFLLIGILYQFSRLVSINKLTFFSWSQVISDSVALFFPILFGIGGYLIANLLDPHIKEHKKFFLQLFLFGIILLVLYLGLRGFGVPYILYQSYLIGVLASILPTLITYARIYTGSEKLKEKNFIRIIRIIIGILLLFMIMTLSKDREYKDLNLIIEGGNKEVIYMNDRYIFTKSNIYHNDESLHFSYSGVIE